MHWKKAKIGQTKPKNIRKRDPDRSKLKTSRTNDTKKGHHNPPETTGLGRGNTNSDPKRATRGRKLKEATNSNKNAKTAK